MLTRHYANTNVEATHYSDSGTAFALRKVICQLAKVHHPCEVSIVSPDEKFFTVTVQTNHGLVFNVTVPDFSHPQQSPTALCPTVKPAEKPVKKSSEAEPYAIGRAAYV